MRTINSGFSFVEVLITMLVLAVGILPIFTVFSQGSSGTIRTRDEILAQIYAEELLDYAMARGFTAVEPTSSDGDLAPTVVVGDLKTAIDPRFTRKLVVKEVKPADHNDDWPMVYRLVAVIVTWNHEGKLRRFVRSGLLFKGVGL